MFIFTHGGYYISYLADTRDSLYVGLCAFFNSGGTQDELHEMKSQNDSTQMRK